MNVECHVKLEASRPIRKILEDNLDIVRFSKLSSISDEQLAFLLSALPKKIREITQTQGYFYPSVRINVIPNKNKRIVKVILKLGTRTMIRSVNVIVTGPIRNESKMLMEKTRNSFKLRSGMPFIQSEWKDAKNFSLEILREKRYLGARLTYSQARIDPNTQKADLTVIYDSGPTFKFGKLSISGVKRYPAWIIEHINSLQFGEVYSRETIRELQRRIQNTPYYSNAAIDIQNDSKKSDKVPVNIRVSEFPYQNLHTGIGYATDWGIRSESTYSHNNMFNRNWVISFEERMEKSNAHGSLHLQAPPEKNGYMKGALASYQSNDIENTKIRSLQLSIQNAQASKFYSQIYSLNYRQDRLEKNIGEIQFAKAFALGFIWGYKNIDDPLFPHKGSLINVETSVSIHGLLSDSSFIRTYSHMRKYFPLCNHNLVLIRTELGAIFSSSNSDIIPASLRFRAGGVSSIRGHDYQSIGENTYDSILPTKYLMTASAEYQHWINNNWGGALFYDIGTATNILKKIQIYSGFGFGIRWNSPIGPINLDLAYNLQKRVIRPYITIGIAF